MSNKIWKGRESIVRYKNRKKHFFQEENSESYLQFPSIFDTKRVLTLANSFKDSTGLEKTRNKEQ